MFDYTISYAQIVSGDYDCSDVLPVSTVPVWDDDYDSEYDD